MTTEIRSTVPGLLVLTLCALLGSSAPAWSQTILWPQSQPRGVTDVIGQPARYPQSRPRGVTDTVDMTGPRFGLTVLTQQTVDRLLSEQDIAVRPMISQFGWQFERRLYTNGDGITMLTEWVPLISGLDQGVALPSLNWLVGLRTASGTEFGLGPNITPVGVGLVLAAGVTMKTGALHVPFNVAVATSKYGPRISIMTGFNVRRR
jgi:hypothetical protein